MDATQEQLPMESGDAEIKSTLKSAALYLNLKQNFMLDDAHSTKWRTEAKKDFDFIAGDQWDEDVTKIVGGEGRVPLTFNFCKPFVQAICGLEIATRHETTFLPRVVEEGDIVANETISATSRWMGDNCDAEDEESAAFQSMVTCGMGWTESRMDYDEEQDGKYVEEQLDPIEMRWDYAAKKKNLKDSRRMWRVRSFTMSEARERFPDADISDLNCSWATGFDGEDKAKTIEERRLKLENSSPGDTSANVHIIQVQWYESECYYRVALADGEKELTEKQWKDLKKALREAAKTTGGQMDLPMAVKARRRVYKQAFLGDKILEMTACPDPKGFTLQCITGHHHKTKNTWFGLVRIMRDPQMNANKWLSQALHILNTTAKGGIIAERSAFQDTTEAQRTYANPQAITFIEDGFIQKLMAKPGAGLAAPYVQLLNFAIEAIPQVTGINLELLGLREVNQPGVLEQQRKQAGMTILGTMFDALRDYRKQNGRIRLTFIQKYIPDGRIIRIVGPEGMKAVRFIRDQHLGEYDVEVSDAPTSPNQKEATWTMVMQLLQIPQFAAMVERDPKVGVELLEYCPLPSKLVGMLRSSLAEPKPEQEQQKQIAMANAQAELDGKAAATEKDRSAVQVNITKAMLQAADAAVKAGQAHAEQQARMAAMAAFSRQQLPMGPLFGNAMFGPGLRNVQGGDAVFPTQFEGRTVPPVQQMPTEIVPPSTVASVAAGVPQGAQLQ